MPLEGHWERQNTPLGRTPARERRLLAVVGALVALATVAIVAYVVVSGGDSASARRGCVAVTVAHTTGGTRLDACGRGAIRLCRKAATEDTPLARALRPQCRRNRVPTTLGAAAP